MGLVYIQSFLKKFPKRTHSENWYAIVMPLISNSIGSKVAVDQSTGDANDYNSDASQPIVHIGAAIEAGLDSFNNATEGAWAN